MNEPTIHIAHPYFPNYRLFPLLRIDFSNPVEYMIFHNTYLIFHKITLRHNTLLLIILLVLIVRHIYLYRVRIDSHHTIQAS